MAGPQQSARRVVRFGVFQVDLRAGELFKQGIKIRLQQQPLRVLALLLEHPGEVVTREDLRQAIWPAGTFVESDVGLDAAIHKLRNALGDSAENPRLVETLPRRGYRFIAGVDGRGSRAPVQTKASPLGRSDGTWGSGVACGEHRGTARSPAGSIRCATDSVYCCAAAREPLGGLRAGVLC